MFYFNILMPLCFIHLHTYSCSKKKSRSKTIGEPLPHGYSYRTLLKKTFETQMLVKTITWKIIHFIKQIIKIRCDVYLIYCAFPSKFDKINFSTFNGFINVYFAFKMLLRFATMCGLSVKKPFFCNFGTPQLLRELWRTQQ